MMEWTLSNDMCHILSNEIRVTHLCVAACVAACVAVYAAERAAVCVAVCVAACVAACVAVCGAVCVFSNEMCHTLSNAI